MLDKLEAIKARFDELGVALTNPAIVSDNKQFSALSKEYRNLEKIVKEYEAYKTVLADLVTYREALNGDDDELRELAKEELPVLEEREEKLESAIRQINQAGGVAVIAHPFASRRGEVISADTFTHLVSAGLHGIEVNHRDHSQAEREQLAEIADQLGLVKTGSSDYHGNGKLNELGENLTDPEQWARLESLASARRVVTK